MSLLVDLKHMLDNANRLLVAQQSVMEQTQFTAVVASLHDSILAKIAGLPSVSIAECHELAGIIGMTVFSVAQKAKLNTVLTSRCLSALQGLGDMPAAASKQQTQGCNYPSVFLTHHDWHTMDDPHKSAMQKITTVVNRFRLLGLTNPTEMAYKHLAALVIATHCAGSTPEQMYNIVVELKNAFGARRKESPPCFRMAEFPDSPSFLPATVAASGYPDPHDRHADRCIDGLAEILATIPLRLSNRCLRPAAKGVASAAAESHVDATASGVIAQVLSHLGMSMGGMQAPRQDPLITFLNRPGGQQHPQLQQQQQQQGTIARMPFPQAITGMPPHTPAGAHMHALPIGPAGGMAGAVGGALPPAQALHRGGSSGSGSPFPPLEGIGGAAGHAAGAGHAGEVLAAACGEEKKPERIVDLMEAIAGGPPKPEAVAAADGEAAASMKTPMKSTKKSRPSRRHTQLQAKQKLRQPHAPRPRPRPSRRVCCLVAPSAEDARACFTIICLCVWAGLSCSSPSLVACLSYLDRKIRWLRTVQEPKVLW